MMSSRQAGWWGMLMATAALLGAAQASEQPGGGAAGAATVTPMAATTAAAGPVMPDLAVDEILARHAQARGGLEAWRRVRGMAFTGRLDAGRAQVLPDSQFANPNASARDRRRVRIERERALASAPVLQLPFRLELARGRKSRLEVQVQDKTAVQVFDGSQGWKLRPFLDADHRLEPYSPVELKLAGDQADLEGWLIDAAAKGYQVVNEGPELVEQRMAWRLKVTLDTGDVRHVWVDTQSFLDVKVEGARTFNGRLRPMYTVQKDFREVGGLRVPFLMETRMEGFRDTERLQVDEATLNPVLARDRFARPS